MTIMADAQYKTGEEMFSHFLEGDTGAFDDLVALYEDELYVFINNIVNDYHEAKHLTIEAFAQLALCGGQFKGNSSIKTYLFAIGKNMALRYVKKRGREQHISLEEVIEVLADKPANPQYFLEQVENRQILDKYMKDLKEEYRVVLILLYFEDMSYKTAGRVMNKSVKQISDLAYRAKAALEKKLRAEEF